MLKNFIHKIFSLEGKEAGTLNIIFCTDEFLKSINIQYLKHDYYTDIITFNLSNPNENTISGEIYISLERVKENAGIHKVSVQNELHRVIFHGVLHLCGYLDKTRLDKALMTEKENTYLDMYF